MQMPDEDEEYARIMARLDELEKEELEDGSTSDDDNEENLAGDEVEDDETGDEDEDAESSSSFSTSDLKHEILEVIWNNKIIHLRLEFKVVSYTLLSGYR